MIVRRNLPSRRRGPSLLRSLSLVRIVAYAVLLIAIISSLCGLFASSYKRKKTVLKVDQQQQQLLLNTLPPPDLKVDQQQQPLDTSLPLQVEQMHYPRTMLRQEQEQRKSYPSSPSPVLLNPLPTSEPDVALILPPSPVRRISLLFDDKANPVLTRHMVERVPVFAKDPRFHLGHREVTVTILRPPGVFGSIIEGFVRQCINKNIDDEAERIDFAIHATSRIIHPPPFKRWSETKTHPEHYYIHAMTLPVLLEAIDLVMMTLDDKRPVLLQSGGVQLTWQDFMDSVKLLVRWHCRASNLAKTLELHDDSNYVMTMTLQSTLEHPLKAEIELLDFLGVTPVDFDRPLSYYPTLLDRTNFTHAAWNRVHQATMLVRAMDNASLLPKPSRSSWSAEQNSIDNVDRILDLQVQSLLGKEMPSPDQCPTDPFVNGGNEDGDDDDLHSMTASVNSIQQLLNGQSLATVCQRQQLPESSFSASMMICRYKNDEQSFYPRLVRELHQAADPNVLFLRIFCQGHPERFLDLCDQDELLLHMLRKNGISSTMSQGWDDDDPAATTTAIVVMDQLLVQQSQQPVVVKPLL
jgi:hypothetical protein